MYFISILTFVFDYILEYISRFIYKRNTNLVSITFMLYTYYIILCFFFLIQLNSCQLMICDILIRITSLNYSFFVVHDNKKLISEFLVEERTGLHFRRFKLYNTSLKKVLSSAKL